MHHESATLSNSAVVAAYRERTPRSAALASEARAVFPSGITHDSRRLDPYPLFVSRAEGARKWDADGNEYVDYFGGHGALLLGHTHPAVTAAVGEQLALGTHFGASHELELRWGQTVQSLVPGAARVRFTSSGTEANLLALRLARAFTGRRRLVRVKGHFHGWQDHAAFGFDSHFDGTPTPGVLPGIADEVLLVPPDDVSEARALIDAHDDIAAVILEPTGGLFGQVPVSVEFVRMLREVTNACGALLVFDEVVTGFRVAPGGAQAHYGIAPDLSTWAKILAGGLPGGCVTGRRDILDLLDFDAARARGVEKIGHQGTYNANPLSAAAGIACLSLVRDTDACARASANGARLRRLLNEVFAEEGVPWAAYGEHSAFFVYMNPAGDPLDPLAFDALALPGRFERLSAKHPSATLLRLALLANGVDATGKPGGTISSAHTDADLERTAAAMRAAVRMLKAEHAIDP